MIERDFMKKPTNIAIIAILGILLLVFALNKFSPKTPTQELQQEAQEMAQAIAKDQPLRCLITNPDNSELAYYLKGSKMKTAFLQDETFSYMINDGEYTYIWQEGSLEGIKTALPTEEEMAETVEQTEDYAKDYPDFYNPDAIVEYEKTGYKVDCQKDSFGDEMFVPPTNVVFTDFATQMQESFSKMQEENAVPEGMENFEIPEDVKNMMEQ